MKVTITLQTVRPIYDLESSTRQNPGSNLAPSQENVFVPYHTRRFPGGPIIEAQWPRCARENKFPNYTIFTGLNYTVPPNQTAHTEKKNKAKNCRFGHKVKNCFSSPHLPFGRVLWFLWKRRGISFTPKQSTKLCKEGHILQHLHRPDRQRLWVINIDSKQFD